MFWKGLLKADARMQFLGTGLCVDVGYMHEEARRRAKWSVRFFERGDKTKRCGHFRLRWIVRNVAKGRFTSMWITLGCRSKQE